mgnify:CR=1 FL=1
MIQLVLDMYRVNYALCCCDCCSKTRGLKVSVNSGRCESTSCVLTTDDTTLRLQLTMSECQHCSRFGPRNKADNRTTKDMLRGMNYELERAKNEILRLAEPRESLFVAVTYHVVVPCVPPPPPPPPPLMQFARFCRSKSSQALPLDEIPESSIALTSASSSATDRLVSDYRAAIRVWPLLRKVTFVLKENC